MTRNTFDGHTVCHAERTLSSGRPEVVLKSDVSEREEKGLAKESEKEGTRGRRLRNVVRAQGRIMGCAALTCVAPLKCLNFVSLSLVIHYSRNISVLLL